MPDPQPGRFIPSVWLQANGFDYDDLGVAIDKLMDDGHPEEHIQLTMETILASAWNNAFGRLRSIPVHLASRDVYYGLTGEFEFSTEEQKEWLEELYQTHVLALRHLEKAEPFVGPTRRTTSTRLRRIQETKTVLARFDELCRRVICHLPAEKCMGAHKLYACFDYARKHIDTYEYVLKVQLSREPAPPKRVRKKSA